MKTMNSGYTKLFGDLITSTIWQEDNNCRVLWITMLALKDKDHVCRATVPALAKICGITNDECEKYLKKFQDPDHYSRNKANEGRRIEACDGGWAILNGEHYQDRLSKEDRRQQVARAVAKFRAKGKDPLGKRASNPRATMTPAPPRERLNS